MISERHKIEYKGQIIFEKIIFTKNFDRSPKLFKEDEACFMFLKNGCLTLRTPTNKLNFIEGDIMLAKCGNYYFEKNNSDAEHSENMVAISAYFYPDLVRKFFDDDFEIKEFRSNNYDSKKIQSNPMLLSCIDSISLLFDNPAIATNNMIITKLKELLILLSKSEQASSVSQFINSLFDPVEYEFGKIIESNLYCNLTLKEFSHLCGISSSTFVRKFKKIYKQSPNKYFLSKKLEKASELLVIESKPISEIAWECGFNSIPYFNSIFKKTYGVTPSRYRLNRLSKKVNK